MAKKKSGTKRTAWDEFSRWVRVKGCIETTGYPFVGVCITCKRRFHIRALDAGHMIPGRSNAKLFHEQLVNPQCSNWCNRMNHGFPKKYRKIMIEKYGKEQIEKWEIEAEKIISNKDMKWAKIKQKYREKTKELLIPFGYSSYEDMLEGHQYG